ncbi:MAG TPA: 3-(cis-5,6-dihydroxycyclohexa-1,3-dien-1-yl)propanoate dehydrogenase [Candidatus Binataceae bacterium]|nr:3-(cis-5,6-dihydroxycyclohexa-1,3-dien-1-yl)propanoate dehydrogenase [Candidatus Binataceae bacterium]
MGWLENKVALVTGGASGLGRAIVERFIEEGAMVAVLDRARERSLELAGRFAGRLEAVIGDVTVMADNHRAVAQTVQRFGRLDCLVGNAGIWDFNTPLAELPDESISEAFDELFGVNVKGYLLAAKAAYRELAKTHGCIIYTVSNAGFYPCGGGPLYTASKHAVVGLIRQLAYELAPKIRVNGVAPGAIPTDLRGPASLVMAERSISQLPIKEMVERGVPLGKLPEPRDYTGSYVLLASAENSSTATGGVIICEGGIGIRGFVDAAGGRNL